MLYDPCSSGKEWHEVTFMLLMLSLRSLVQVRAVIRVTMVDILVFVFWL